MTASAPSPRVGTWLKLGAVETMEIVAAAGLDFAIVDLEHALIDLHTLNGMLACAAGLGIDALVRVPDHSPALAKQALDNGAAGIVVPNVDTAEQARRIAGSLRFPPMGSRGLSVSGRAGGWGRLEPLNYMARQNDSAQLWLQIESPRAVRNAAEIAAVDGVDGLLVGPADLFASTLAAEAIGDHAVGLATTRVGELLAELEETCRAGGIALGTAGGTDPAVARQLADRGYCLLVLGNDAGLLHAGARELASIFRPTIPTP